MKVNLYTANVKFKGKRYSKSYRLSTGDIIVELYEYQKSYDEYVQPLISYYSENEQVLARALNVKDIIKKGEYIMGIFGGEEKRGKETYAGLVVVSESYDKDMDKCILRLYRMDSSIDAPHDLFEKYDCGIFNLIYRGCIHPFNISCIYRVLLSKGGSENLKKFLQEVLILNEDRLAEDNVRKLEILIKEVVQPREPKFLDKGMNYVIYRGKRTFSAIAFKPKENNYILDSSVASIDCSDEEDKAYFYAAVLNYLAYKAIQLRRPFIRDQYARPIRAIIGAELTWNIVSERDEKLAQDIVKLSKELHIKASERFRDKKYSQERQAFNDLESIGEFQKLILLLDNYISKYVGHKQLEDALSWVAGLKTS